MKANSRKAKTMAQQGWSYNSLQHLKAEMHIKSKKKDYTKISQPVKVPKQPKTHNYQNNQLNPSLNEFQRWLHNGKYNFLILDLEFNVVGEKNSIENTHIFQIAGQVFNSFERFNYYNLNRSMRSNDQLQVLRATNAQYSQLANHDCFPEIAQRIQTFVAQHHITHIISWGNSQDISEIQFWENHYHLPPTFSNHIKWIDLCRIIGTQLSNGDKKRLDPSLTNFYKTLGLLDNNIQWHQAHQDVQAINQICHVYYEINHYTEDI